MQGTALILAADFLFVGVVIPVAAPSAGQPRVLTAAAQDQPYPQPKIRVFMGTITKVGDQFVFTDDTSKVSYQLDDEKTASRFEGQKVRVTGTLDAVNNLIRVQSIEAAAA